MAPNRKIEKDSPWREAESPVVQHPLLCAEMSEAQFANVAANVELFGGRILSNIQQSPAIWPRWELFKFCLYTLGGALHCSRVETSIYDMTKFRNSPEYNVEAWT